MGKIFGASASNGAVYKLGTAKVDIEGAKCVFLNVTLSMTRQMTPIPTLGNGIQWAAAPASGTMNVGTILTKDSTIMSKLHADDDACKSTSMTIQATDCECSSGGSSGGKTFEIKGAYCNSVSFTLNPGQGYIANDLGVVFTEMSVS